MHNYFETVDLPLFTADFDYFRLPPERWGLLLSRLVQLGIRTVNLPVPWRVHEAQAGAIDFSGTTSARTELIGLLESCAALELTCRLLPGPYLDQRGLLRTGLPAWLPAGPRNFEPDFEAKITGWLKALSQALVAYQWPAGPIVSLQFNFGANLANGSLVLSEQLREVNWPIWLRKRYQGLAALNTAYGTSYQTVSEVKFPRPMQPEETPLMRDARAFVQELRQKARERYLSALREAGWHIPLFPLEPAEVLPAEQPYSLLSPEDLPAAFQADKLIVFQHPIRSDDEPPDIAAQPAWAEGAPIRADGSTRRSFATLRQQLWSQQWPDSEQEGPLLTASFAGGGLVLATQDTELAVRLTRGTKPVGYHLYGTGSVQEAPELNVSRARLKGRYLTEDALEQIDLVFYLVDTATPVGEPLAAYLRQRLLGQQLALERCAADVETLGQAFAPRVEAEGEKKRPVTPAKEEEAPLPYAVAEARRGLREAETTLRKAIASIGGLEAGFGTILGKSGEKTAPDALEPVHLTPAAFEGATREVLIEIGTACRKIAIALNQAADGLRTAADQPLTVKQYQHSYAKAASAAQTAREPLLEIIRRLRLEIASEQLPLVTWRVHNQVEAVTERLRWDVLRGKV